jgi:hypothetical protein
MYTIFRELSKRKGWFGLSLVSAASEEFAVSAFLISVDPYREATA